MSFSKKGERTGGEKDPTRSSGPCCDGRGVKALQVCFKTPGNDNNSPEGEKKNIKGRVLSGERVGEDPMTSQRRTPRERKHQDRTFSEDFKGGQTATPRKGGSRLNWE